jgi:L-fuculose phosphate aldolase, putative
VFCSHELQKKLLIIKAGKILTQKGLVERTWGNVSISLDGKHFAISPTGASYANLQPEDIPVVTLELLTFVGRKKPSSELLIHSSIYNNYPNISFILHTHQRFASLLSLFFANKQGSIEVSDEYKDTLGNIIPVAEYAEAGTKQIAKNVIKALTSSKNHSFSISKGIVLMAAHGVVCFASNFDDAFSIAEKLEDFAKNLISNTLKKHGVFLEPRGSLNTYTRSSFPNHKENPTLNELCSLIFNEAPDVFFITLSKLPISQHISKKLETKTFPDIIEFQLKGIPAYFDDAAQILGESAIVISSNDDISLLKKNSIAIFTKHTSALIIQGIGTLFFSQKEDETIYMASIFEKNALSFLLSLYHTAIIPLENENARSLHTSFMQGYSKLRDC